MTKNGLEYDRKNSHRLKVYACTWACVSSASSGAVLCCYCCGLALVSTLLILVAPGQSYAHKIARLQAVVVVKAVWGIFNNTNRSLFTSNTLLVIYKSRYYNMNVNNKNLLVIVSGSVETKRQKIFKFSFQTSSFCHSKFRGRKLC